MKALLAALLLGACAGPACGPRPVATLPITFLGDLPLVTLTLDGVALPFVLDTGAQTTVVGDAAGAGAARDATRLRRSEGVGGVSVRPGARLRLGVAGVEIGDARVGVVPLPDLGPRGPVGLFGRDVLGQFELDIDQPGGLLRLWRGAPCDLPPDWSGGEAVPLQPVGQGGFGIAVRLDGRDHVALLDTGALVGTITPEAAGIAASALAADPAIKILGAGPNAASARLHRFGALQVGAMAFARPRLLVGGLPAVEMLIGEDLMRRRRVWISPRSGKVWFGARIAAE